MTDDFVAAYMLASRRHGTLYVGSTIGLVRRMWEHREGVGSRFVSKYSVTRLVWYELFGSISEARDREYRIKNWRRDWKANLIERDNPQWTDLYPALIGAVPRTKFKLSEHGGS